MNHQEAITAQAIHMGRPLPKASNFDKPERRVARMIAKGWVAPSGTVLTPAGREAVASYGEREGWRPETIALLRGPEGRGSRAGGDGEEKGEGRP